MNLGHITLRDLQPKDSDKCPDRIYGQNDMGQLRRDLADVREICDLKFITGNQNKVEELTKNLKLEHINLACENIDLMEIQGSDELAIIQDKCQRAHEAVKSKLSNGQRLATLVDDTSLNLSALGGMPGPYVKCECSEGEGREGEAGCSASVRPAVREGQKMRRQIF